MSCPWVRQVHDQVAEEIAAQPVRRIVSLAPNLTETLFALGAGNLVVGDTDYCDYPPEARTKRHVGGPVNPSLEQVAALQASLGRSREARKSKGDQCAPLWNDHMPFHCQPPSVAALIPFLFPKKGNSQT